MYVGVGEEVTLRATYWQTAGREKSRNLALPAVYVLDGQDTLKAVMCIAGSVAI